VQPRPQPQEKTVGNHEASSATRNSHARRRCRPRTIAMRSFRHRSRDVPLCASLHRQTGIRKPAAPAATKDARVLRRNSPKTCQENSLAHSPPRCRWTGSNRIFKFIGARDRH